MHDYAKDDESRYQRDGAGPETCQNEEPMLALGAAAPRSVGPPLTRKCPRSVPHRLPTLRVTTKFTFGASDHSS